MSTEVIGSPVDEEESGHYLATIMDRGSFVPGSNLTYLRLTQYVVLQNGSTAIVNNRNGQNVLNQGGVVVYDVIQQQADGQTYNLLWNLQPADTTLVEPTLPFETHYFMFEWGWSGGDGKHERAYVVRNLRMVT